MAGMQPFVTSTVPPLPARASFKRATVMMLRGFKVTGICFVLSSGDLQTVSGKKYPYICHVEYDELISEGSHVLRC